MRLGGLLLTVLARLASCGGGAATEMATPVKNVEPSTTPSEPTGDEFAAGPHDQPRTMTAWRVHYVCNQ